MLASEIERLSTMFKDGAYDHGELIGPAWPTLMPLMRDTKHRGMSAHLGDVQVLAYSMAGRVMVTFRRGEDSITFIGADGYLTGPEPGWQGIEGKIRACREIVADAMRRWDIQKFKADDDVGVG